MGKTVGVRRRVSLLALAGLVAALLAPVPAAAAPDTYVFPVVGRSGYAHRHSEYPASDIIAACGLPVVSPVHGVVLEVNRIDYWARGIKNRSTRGGKFVSIRGDDGVRYYHSHLAKVRRGLAPGVRVVAGQRIGRVGRTGRAGACHLHFGISPVCDGAGDWWIRRGVIWPWPYLDSWRKSDSGLHLSPVDEIAAWHQANGCPPDPSLSG